MKIHTTTGAELGERNVTLYDGVLDKIGKPIHLMEVLEAIQAPYWDKQVEAIRSNPDKADLLKKRLPAFTAAGVFSKRCKTGLDTPSGCLIVDVDKLDSMEIAEALRDALGADPHVLAAFISPSGLGVKAVVHVGTCADDGEAKAAWRALAEYLAKTYSIQTDPSGKDVCRLCFVSHDPGAIIRTGEVRPFTARGEMSPIGDIPEPPAIQPDAPSKADATAIESALDSISADCTYSDWFAVACAVKNGLGNEGFTLFDSWSRTAPTRYDAEAAKRVWDSTEAEKPEGVTVATLYRMAETGSATTPDSLVAKYGPAYFMNKTKKGFAYAGMNEGYFAGLHASENIELWEPNEKAFFRYCEKSGLFAEVTADLLKQEVSKQILDMARARRVKGLMQDRNAPRLNAIVQQLKGVVEQRDAFRKDRRFLHLANGILDLSGDEPTLLPFSPDFRSRNASPIAYDPRATCQRFLDDLILPAVHPEDVAIIQKYMGLALLGRNIIQRLLILDGMAGRGKSQLSIVIQHLVGMVNCTQLRTEHLNERFELYRFLRKTLLAGVDVSPDFLSARGAPVLKGLVGGDIMDAEQKGGTGCFPIEGTFNVIITCNSRLRVRLEGDVGAWRRRLLIVRYEAPPPAKKIPDFGAHLVKTEGAGILNWAIEGLGALLDDVEQTGDIRLTPRQSGVVDSLLAESDSLRQFLADRVERAEGDDLSVHEIVEAYAEYCPANGWSPLPITIIQRQIEGLMLELFQTVKVGSIQRDGKSARGFRNVRYKVQP